MNTLLVAGLVISMAGWFVLSSPRIERLRVALALQGDEDMKIASPGGFSAPREDLAEQAARQFLEQKRNGNVDRARELGERYAQALIQQRAELFPREGQEELRHHRMLLYSYVVTRVIADLSPNSIVAQTALNVFYNTLETCAPALYRHVSDPAAFSLYILCERSHNRTDDAIGRIFADLSGFGEDPRITEEGNALFRDFYTFCADKHREAGYIN